MAEPYRVLALDGGGLRGIFTAAVLTEAEDAFGPAFLDSFDLLVGTSTGGIVALGLASGRTGREMLDFYREAGRRIFARPRRLRRLIGPKYGRQALDRLLRQEFGAQLRMNDLQRPVCITAHELVHGTTRVIKDDHAPGLRWGGDQLVWKVAAATSAAPTYFAPVQLGEADSHIDGGVWGNNPAMVGITEAVRYGERRLEDVRLLSVGTTSQVLRVRSHRSAEELGPLGWGLRALDLLQGSASLAAHHQASLLLGPERYLRIDSELAQPVKMDDATRCEPLQEWGHDEARHRMADIGRLLGLEQR